MTDPRIPNGIGGLQVVGWRRILTGETGFVGAIDEGHWLPVATIEEAGRLSPEEADDTARRIREFVATHAWVVDVDA